MAIQNRRGVYADYDPSKLKPGEFAVVQSGDPDSDDGRAIFLCISAGVVKQIATLDQLKTYQEDAAASAADAEEAAEAAAAVYLNADQTMQQVNAKAAAIQAATVNSDQIATQALTKASNLENDVADALNVLNKVKSDTDALKLVTEGKVDGGYVENGYLVLTSGGEAVSDPIGPFATGGGGGGGGGEINGATLTVTNTNGWISKTIAGSDTCPIQLTWSSIEDDQATGNGTMRVTVNGLVKAVIDIAQGPVSVDVSPYLATGANIVKVSIADIYNNSRTYNFSITVVKISISSPFDCSAPFTGAISFPFVPVGQVTKTVHFKLDGTELDTLETPVSDRQMSYTIPAQSHGAHTLECYFTAEINGQTVTSNTLYYEMICIQNLNLTPIITANFSSATVDQYSTVQIEYQVYDPSALTAATVLKVDGTQVQSVTVDRQKHVWSYRADTTGSHTLTITSGGETKTITLTVTAVQMDIEAETNGLELYLSSYGRSNGEANPGMWTSGSVTSTFTNFNFVSDGWVQDDDGITVLRLSGDARLTINYKLFETDFRTTGKTIELEFATRDVRDYDAAIIECMSGGRGLKVTAQEATLASEQSSITKQYKDDEHLRIAFVVEKRTGTRLIQMYIDGVLSGVVQYPTGDDFSQLTPVNISCGSSDCGLDLYCIRVYDHDLSRVQVLNNWICDTQDGTLMMERYTRNNIYDSYGQIVTSKLPKDLPYMILEAPELPQFKGDKKTVSGQYVDPVATSKSFTFTGASANVQGTSSQYYSRKNYKITFKNGFISVSGTQAKYALKQGAIPVDTFCFKADVASSEGANNVELVRLYNEACPYKTPPQVANAAVRQGIDGFPMVIFHNDGTNTNFLGKYNFNNDKGTEEVYGFAAGDESWETLNNTSNRALFKGWADSSWADDFEGRYPDGSEAITNLKSFVETVAGWTNPTAAQIEAVAEKQSAIFYYLFTELFLMVDSRAKNAFPTKYSGGKWCWLPYDFDTAIGINNEGQYVFNYSLETGDKLTGGADVFNGEGHKFWAAVKEVYANDIATMYGSLRSSGALSFEKTRQMFDDHQAKWPEAIFNEDSQYKYLDPLIVDSDAGYLTMLQGSKKSVRDWWLFHRYLYMDSKYNVADNQTRVITVRGYAKSNLKVTPYSDIYVNIKYGSSLVSARGKRNTSYTLNCPLDNVNDTETYIYGADQIKKIEGLPEYQVGYANFAMATKLQEIVLGSNASGYSNSRLTELHLGDLKLLKKIDCRNCTALGTGTMATIDASGCSQIEEIYMDGTKITGIDLPNGGQLKKLHLPSTITSLVIRNQTKLEELTIPDYSGITTLILESVSSVANPLTLLDEIASNARVRLTGIDLGTVTVAQLTAFMDKLDTFRGIDDAGGTTDTAQVAGTCHITNVTGAEMATFKSRYPYINVTYDHLSAFVKYYSDDGETLLYTETVVDGANAVYTGTATKTSTAQYNYVFDGWAATPGGALWNNAKVNVTADRNLYAHFQANLRYYTVYFYNGSTLLQTVPNVPYGGSASYTAGSTSSITNSSGDPFTGWNPLPSNITGNTSCYAQFVPMYNCVFKNGDTTLYTVRVRKGQNAVYAGETDVNSLTDANGRPFIGWDKSTSNIQANTTFNAVFFDFEENTTDSWDTIVNSINAAADGATCGYAVGTKKVVDFGGDVGQVCMVLTELDKDNLAVGGKAKTAWSAIQLGKTSRRMNPALVTNTHQEVTASGAGWVADTENGGYKSNNQSRAGTTATATFTLTPAADGTLTISYKVGSESNYDKLTLKVNGSTVANAVSGNIDWTTHDVTVTSGTAVTVQVSYQKDSSGDQNGDTAYVKWSGVDVTVAESIQTWEIKSNVTDGYGANTGGLGGWEHSEMRAYVRSLKDNLPEALKAPTGIKNVIKTQPAWRVKESDPTKTETYTQTTTDDIFLLSYDEVFSSSAAVNYTSYYSDNTARKKKKVGASSASIWWLRSVDTNGASYFGCVRSGGSNYTSAGYTYGIALGFCI